MLAAAPSSESVERSPGLKNKRRRASSISNIQQNLLELRREYDNLQSVSHELRTEIAILNDSMQNKERDICDKTQRICELEERNRRLAEDMEANTRLNSDLRAQLDTALTNANTHSQPMDPHPSLRRQREGSANEVIDVY